MNIPWGGDLAVQYIPWYWIAADYLHSFSLPHWVPGIYDRGYPLLAEGETGALSPINALLLFLFPFDLSINLLFATYFLIAIGGVFYFLRTAGLGKAAAFLGGVVFGLSGFMVSRYFMPGVLFASALAPFGFWVVLKSVRDASFVLFLPFVVYLQITAGHLQMTLISCLGYLAFIFFYLGKRKTGLFLAARVTFAIVIGFGLAAPQILPSLKLFQISERREWTREIRYSYSLPASHLITYISPYYFGISEPGNNFGFMGFGGSFWEFNLTIWTVPLLLAFVGLTTLKGKGSRLTFALVLMWLVFILLSFGGYFKPYRIVGHLPDFPFRAPSRFLLINTFAISSLAALGFEKLFAKRGPFLKITAIGLIVGSIIFQQGAMFGKYYQFASWEEIKNSISDLTSYKMASPLYIDPTIPVDSMYNSKTNVFADEFRKGTVIAVFSLGILYLWKVLLRRARH
ncbi:MAG: hypothetical protein WD988_03840 [Candidatus Curtissbacteria bacterium]